MGAHALPRLKAGHHIHVMTGAATHLPNELTSRSGKAMRWATMRLRPLGTLQLLCTNALAFLRASNGASGPSQAAIWSSRRYGTGIWDCGTRACECQVGKLHVSVTLYRIKTQGDMRWLALIQQCSEELVFNTI